MVCDTLSFSLFSCGMLFQTKKLYRLFLQLLIEKSQLKGWWSVLFMHGNIRSEALQWMKSQLFASSFTLQPLNQSTLFKSQNWLHEKSWVIAYCYCLPVTIKIVVYSCKPLLDYLLFIVQQFKRSAKGLPYSPNRDQLSNVSLKNTWTTGYVAYIARLT